MTNERCQENRFKPLWALASDLIFLNHGSFGACPLAVLERQHEIIMRMESDPIAFFVQNIEPALAEAKAPLAAMVNAPEDDVTFITNTTFGVNAVLRSLCLAPGDEIIATNHIYNACRTAVDFVAQRTGAHFVIVDIPATVDSAEEITTAILAQCTDKTVLALIDHITSPTALVFPIEEIVERLRQLGIPTLVDGAHAPGMVPIDIAALRPAYYVGNCHKWCCAPKGAALLYVAPELQEQTRPLAISHGANSERTDRSRFLLEFEWTGTQDISPWLTVPFTLDYMASLVPGRWAEIQHRNHQQALRGGRTLCDALEIDFPVSETLVGSMVNIPLPRMPRYADGSLWSGESLRDTLFEQYRIQALFHDFPNPGDVNLRISAMLYNSDSDYQTLAQTLRTLLSQ